VEKQEKKMSNIGKCREKKHFELKKEAQMKKASETMFFN
jgi:hypothetical protein